jgi:hypothetical protein
MMQQRKTAMLPVLCCTHSCAAACKQMLRLPLECAKHCSLATSIMYRLSLQTTLCQKKLSYSKQHKTVAKAEL